MVTSIQLGNFFTSNGKTVLGGVGGSGLDTEGMIKGLVEAKELPKKALEDQIALNDKRTTALGDLKTLLGKFKDATNFLRNPPGVANAADNVFKATTATVTSNTAVAANNYVTVTTSAGTVLQNYQITEITSVAKATQQASGNITVADTDSAAAVFTSPGAGQIQAGSITLRGKTITLSAGDTLNGVVAKFNAVSDTTGIRANTVQIADGSYQLFFSGTETGLDNEFDFRSLTTPDVISDPSGVLASLSIRNIQDADNAVFTMNGIEFTRSTNTVDDAVSGVTFNLLQATPEDTTLNVSVGSDKDLIKAGIVNFVNTYNELRTFVAQQTQVKADGTGYEDTAVLHDNLTLRSIMDNVMANLSASVDGLADDAPSLLAEIGITFSTLPATTDTPEVKNILTVDEGKLTSAIQSKTEQVRRIFEASFTSDNEKLQLFKTSNTTSVSEFTVNVNPYATQTTGTITVADADTAVVQASPGAGQIGAGTISINGQDIELEVGDTLNQILAKFAAVEDDSGLAASLTTVDTGQYKLVFTSTVSAGSVNFNLASDDVDPDGAFNNLSFTTTAKYQATYTKNSVETTVDLDVSTIGTDSGYLLKGPAGSALEGMQLIYSSMQYSSKISVNTTNGIASKVFELASNALVEDTGAIALEVKAITTNDDKLNNDISRIEDQVTLFRNKLLQQFADLEKALSQVNTLLQSIQANTDARNNS